MKLYGLPGCSYCEIVKQKLANLSLEYDTVTVPAKKSERKEVKAVSGQEYVPVLVDGSKVLSDENEIISYLDNKYGKK